MPGSNQNSRKVLTSGFDKGRQLGILTAGTYRSDMLIGDITPSAELMLTQTERKIAEEHRKTFEV